MPKRKPRADGRYQAKLQIATIDGKPKYKYVYAATQKELNEKLAILRVELGKGTDLTQPMTLSFWIDRWLQRSKQTQTEAWHNLCDVRAEYWRQSLGSRDISKLTTADLEDVLFSLAAENPKTHKPSGVKTLKEYRGLISRVFALAVRNRAITYDPSVYVELPQGAPKRRRAALTEAEVEAIRAAPHECRLPCLIMIYAGLRFGELAALTWADVDLDASLLTVNKSYDFKTQKIKPPKTAAGVRTVPIPAPLAELLRQQPRAALLVSTHNNAMWTQSSWKFACDRYLQQLGISATAHCLRHTYATILYEAGVDVLTAQRWLGHADAQTTIGIYTHLREQQQSSSVALLNAHLTPQKKSKDVTSVSK